MKPYNFGDGLCARQWQQVALATAWWSDGLHDLLAVLIDHQPANSPILDAHSAISAPAAVAARAGLPRLAGHDVATLTRLARLPWLAEPAAIAPVAAAG